MAWQAEESHPIANLKPKFRNQLHNGLLELQFPMNESSGDFYGKSYDSARSNFEKTLLRASPCGYFGRNQVPDETTRSFDEHKFVCQATFQQ